MNNVGTTELIVVLLAMAGLLVIAIAAVAIFFRVWKKEKGGRKFFD